MRPPNCFGGNNKDTKWVDCESTSFNEAAELLRRKPTHDFR